MHNVKFRQTIIIALAILALSIAALWSLNVLSALFGGPTLQYKHALAALILLAILKSSRPRRHNVREPGHGHRDH